MVWSEIGSIFQIMAESAINTSIKIITISFALLLDLGNVLSSTNPITGTIYLFTIFFVLYLVIKTITNSTKTLMYLGVAFAIIYLLYIVLSLNGPAGI